MSKECRKDVIGVIMTSNNGEKWRNIVLNHFQAIKKDNVILAAATHTLSILNLPDPLRGRTFDKLKRCI